MKAKPASTTAGVLGLVFATVLFRDQETAYAIAALLAAPLPYLASEIGTHGVRGLFRNLWFGKGK